MEVRNPRYVSGGQAIDCEYLHPVDGWVTYTVVPKDSAPTNKALWAILQGMEIASYTPPAPTREQVKDERVRRLDAGRAFSVEGHETHILVTGRGSDQTALLGLLARAEGYRAAGVTKPIITYRDGTNTIYKLTPNQMIDLISAGMAWFEAVMDASWTLLDGESIPADFADDKWWPA